MKRSPSLKRKDRPHRTPGRLRDIALAVVNLALVALLAARAERAASLEMQGVAAVIDGDTVRLGGERVRLKGIDAPELDQTCQRAGATQACGRQARAVLERLTDGRPMRCRGWERDRHGRLLAVCHAGETDLNGAMVASGWAVAFGAYEAEEARARLERRGMWAGSFDAPRVWRARRGTAGERPHDLLSAAGNWLRQILFDPGAPSRQE
ncbi:MAG: nuclease [Phyllobacteriaceae bacterium]|nr:nuclease [Phyllobacteriaceae bacterium]MBA90455.1 nuclease [Phyllobacteriaceae bacterium]